MEPKDNVNGEFAVGFVVGFSIFVELQCSG